MQIQNAALTPPGEDNPSSRIRAAIIVSDQGNYNNEDACYLMASVLHSNNVAPTVVRFHEIDTMPELLLYDVFIFESCGQFLDDLRSGYGIIQDEVRAFVDDHGRGGVGVGGANYTCSRNQFFDYDAVMPVNVLVPYPYLWGYDLDVFDPPHPVTVHVNDFGFGGEDLTEWCPGGIKSTAAVQGEYVQNGRESVVCWETGQARGRAVWLGPFNLADMHGMTVYSETCPSLPGRQLWFQSLDVEAGVLSNGWESVIR